MAKIKTRNGVDINVRRIPFAKPFYIKYEEFTISPREVKRVLLGYSRYLKRTRPIDFYFTGAKVVRDNEEYTYNVYFQPDRIDIGCKRYDREAVEKMMKLFKIK